MVPQEGRSFIPNEGSSTPVRSSVDVRDGDRETIVVPVILRARLGQRDPLERAHRVEVRPWRVYLRHSITLLVASERHVWAFEDRPGFFETPRDRKRGGAPREMLEACLLYTSPSPRDG